MSVEECPICAAMTSDAERHRAWHAKSQVELVVEGGNPFGEAVADAVLAALREQAELIRRRRGGAS